jgi:DNA polymerase-3 subunit beta
MKCTLNRDALFEALTRVQSVVSSRSTIPVLANVLVEARDNQLTLTTTDMELSVTTTVAAEVATPGVTTLPAKRLFSVVRELPSQQIQLQMDDKNTATIECGSSFFKILGLSPDDYPEIPTPEGNQSFTLEADVIKTMLKSVQYAASVDETRYVLNGILFSFKDKKLTTVATDGRRLALCEHELDFPEENAMDMVVPAKAVNELMRNLGAGETCTLTAAGNQVVFELEGMRLISKLIDGTFPNYQQVIPAQCEERITLERETLLQAVRRVSLVTSEQSNSIRLSFEENQVQVLSSTPDVGEAKERVPVKYSGPQMTIAYNPEFLLAPLRVLDCDEVYLELTDELSPGVMKADINFLYVIMPMRMQ